MPLHLYNTLTHKKEIFLPVKPLFVGVYVCGPTVYGDAHLGHARPAIVFDILFRYLKALNFKVRYVRNITDVGHLENDADEGEDKIAKKARLERLEPMEIAQYYTDRYHFVMDALNVTRPSIEPRASGHIPEQIAMIERIIEQGFGYVVKGSVYLDVPKYIAAGYHYGQLSGRNIEETQAGYRDLDGQGEKRNGADFALWKSAKAEHIMQWQSPWGMGFPGWHIECSAMSIKYLGEPFDIHGGGLDLMFPHHEAEIAQANACQHLGVKPQNQARYWLHCNMITINGGQKMGKSLGNFITLEQFFTGKHLLLTQKYDPQTIRFFILQAHYRSTLDFSNEGLQAAEKGLNRLQKGVESLEKIKPATTSSVDIMAWRKNLYEAMDDDLNTAVVIAHLFEGLKIIHSILQNTDTISANDLHLFKEHFYLFFKDILGLKVAENEHKKEGLDKAMSVLINLRQEARKDKNFALSDKIRDDLNRVGILLKDGAEGTEWEVG